jgi:hypothetical protein
LAITSITSVRQKQYNTAQEKILIFGECINEKPSSCDSIAEMCAREQKCKQYLKSVSESISKVAFKETRITIWVPVALSATRSKVQDRMRVQEFYIILKKFFVQK